MTKFIFPIALIASLLGANTAWAQGMGNTNSVGGTGSTGTWTPDWSDTYDDSLTDDECLSAYCFGEGSQCEAAPGSHPFNLDGVCVLVDLPDYPLPTGCDPFEYLAEYCINIPTE